MTVLFVKAVVAVDAVVAVVVVVAVVMDLISFFWSSSSASHSFADLSFSSHFLQIWNHNDIFYHTSLLNYVCHMASFYYIEVLDHAISRVWLRFSTYHLLPRERKKPSEYFNFCICRWQELNLGILRSQRVFYQLHHRRSAITMF